MTLRAWLFLSVLLIVSLALGACGDFKITKIQKLDSSSPLRLPPVGFNHVYGVNPLASEDAMSLERQFFAHGAYWEVYLLTEPAQAGFVKLGNFPAVRAARRDASSLIVALATEDPFTINGLLAYPGHPGPEAYAQELLQSLRALGYDTLSSGQVRIYFSEAYEYALLAWNKASGYTYTVYLKGVSPAKGASPLPAPPALPSTP
jgi:hypothetical protein